MRDVAVVGGGLAGLAVAAHCARAGLDVVVFEEHPRIGEPTHCTGIVSVEVEEFAKLSDDLILKRLHRARLTSPGAHHAEIVWQGSHRERIFAIDRAKFDRRLAEQATEAGAQVLTGARVEAIVPGPRDVVLQVSGRAFRARTCVLACGVSYRFQRQLGLGLPGDLLHTAQVEVLAEPSRLVELHLGRDVAPGGFLWVVPVKRDGGDAVKIGVLARGNASAFLERFVTRPAVAARFHERPAHPLRRLLPLRTIARTYADRLLVVGDAGGFTKPTTGGGIFYGLLTASLAAETLVEAFQRGRFDEAALAEYERRWQDRLGQELRVAGWLRHFLTRCTDAEIDALVETIAADDVRAPLLASARFNWHRDLILALAGQPRIASLLFRSLFR
jgi:geranylgeranyl reductase family protein